MCFRRWLGCAALVPSHPQHPSTKTTSASFCFRLPVPFLGYSQRQHRKPGILSRLPKTRLARTFLNKKSILYEAVAVGIFFKA